MSNVILWGKDESRRHPIARLYEYAWQPTTSPPTTYTNNTQTNTLWKQNLAHAYYGKRTRAWRQGPPKARIVAVAVRNLRDLPSTEVCLKSFRCQEFFGKLRIHGAMLLRAPNKFAGAGSLPPSLLRSQPTTPRCRRQRQVACNDR
jgi:hypothetical protein